MHTIVSDHKIQTKCSHMTWSLSRVKNMQKSIKLHEGESTQMKSSPHTYQDDSHSWEQVTDMPSY